VQGGYIDRDGATWHGHVSAHRFLDACQRGLCGKKEATAKYSHERPLYVWCCGLLWVQM
jgi:hypothetical protein